jgi:CTP:molybdopterin cytidylyltransferase MocA
MTGAADMAVTAAGCILAAGLAGWFGWKALVYCAEKVIDSIDWITRHERNR